MSLAQEISRNLGDLKPGTLSFWGCWFGKPYDNIHRIVGASETGSTISIRFDMGENLIIDNPEDWSLDGGCIRVGNARRVRFEWFDNGKQPSTQSARYIELVRSDEGISLSTDMKPRPSGRPVASKNAVKLHG